MLILKSHGYVTVQPNSDKVPNNSSIWEGGEEVPELKYLGPYGYLWVYGPSKRTIIV